MLYPAELQGQSGSEAQGTATQLRSIRHSVPAVNPSTRALVRRVLTCCLLEISGGSSVLVGKMPEDSEVLPFRDHFSSLFRSDNAGR